MAAESYRKAFHKYFGEKFTKLTRDSTANEVTQVYNDWATYYDKEIAGARCFIQKSMADCVDSAVKRLLPEKQSSEIKVIDAGAGTGLVGVELQKLGFTNVDALDISQEMLNEAKKKNVYNKFICAPLTDQRIAEIETGGYDALICVIALGIAHVRCTAFVEMIRMVRNGGLLCFNIRDDTLKEYQEKMVELEKAGKWKFVSKEKVLCFESDDMPRDSNAFVYKVLENI